MYGQRYVLALLGLSVACDSQQDDAHANKDKGSIVALDADAAVTATSSTAPTYWQDMLPLFEAHCLQCHQQGGSGPFRLDDYAQAKANAPLIAHSTKVRKMPPWQVTSDGSCNAFQHSLALSDAAIEQVAAWVAGGAREGTKTAVTIPIVDSLPAAKDYALPTYLPEIQGGVFAESDDYRCFLLDPDVTEERYITGYEVVPGTPETVHHAAVSIIDPDGLAEPPAAPGTTNRQMMEMLDQQSPDRLGWPCYGLAGEGVSAVAVPVVWAPGQGVIKYPGESGVLLSPKHKLVVQVHYNLADPNMRGRPDATKVRFQLAEQVPNIGVFVTPDAFLQSLRRFPSTDSLPPGLESAPYTWRKTLKDMKLDTYAELSLWGVMPHMHQRGRKQQLRVQTTAGATAQCASDIQSWDYHWQRMYFFDKPWPLSAGAEFEVTCDYDTTDTTMPVLPGWGARNEMCLATMYFTTPNKPKAP